MSDAVLEQPKIIKKKCSICKKFVVMVEEYITCPFCNSLYWSKPEKERQLFVIQDKFLDNGRNPEILGEMQPILLSYVKFLLLKMLRGKRKLTAYEIDIKVNEVIERLVIYYLQYPEWKISSSFAGILKFGIIEVLYGGKKHDQVLSLNHKIGEKKDKELNELIINKIGEDNLSIHHEYLIKNNILVKHLMKYIVDFLNVVRFEEGEKYYLYTLMGVRFLLSNKDKDFIDGFFNLAGIEVQENARELYLDIKEEIKEFIKGTQD